MYGKNLISNTLATEKICIFAKQRDTAVVRIRNQQEEV